MKRTLLPSNEKFDSTASCHPPSCNFSCHISVGSFSDWKVGRIFRNALFIATILAKMKFFASSFQSKSDGCAAHFWRKTHRSSLFSSRVIFLLSIEKISHLSNVNNDLDSKNHDLLVSFFAQSRCCPISGLCVYAAVQSAVFACTLLSNQRSLRVRCCPISDLFMCVIVGLMRKAPSMFWANHAHNLHVIKFVLVVISSLAYVT